MSLADRKRGTRLTGGEPGAIVMVPFSWLTVEWLDCGVPEIDVRLVVRKIELYLYVCRSAVGRQ